MSYQRSRSSIYIAWTAFQRRQVSMAPLVGFECVFLPLDRPVSGKLAKLSLYFVQLLRTISVLRKIRPETVWVQLPQVPLLWAVLLYRLFFARKTKIVADCHNAMFRAPWSIFPGGISLLRNCDLILVHNQSMLDAASSLGLPAARTLVLEDVPPSPASDETYPVPAILAGSAKPWVLFPGSFSADEPIKELLHAAQMLGGATIVMTGRTANAARNGHDISQVPANVRMPGYLSVPDFDALLMHCDLVLALTRFDGIQLSVCNEAIGYGKPMVLSDTKLLRQLFSDAAVMVSSADPAALAGAIKTAVADTERLSVLAKALAERRREAWLNGQYSAVGNSLA